MYFEAGHLAFNAILGFYPDQSFAFCIKLQREKNELVLYLLCFLLIFLMCVMYFSNFMIFTICFSTSMSTLLDETLHCNVGLYFNVGKYML